MKKNFGNFLKKINIEKLKTFLKESKKTILPLLIAAIFADIFFIKTNSDFIIFSILILYTVYVKISHIKSKHTFLLCLALLLVMFISYLINSTTTPTEKAAVWLVLFMAVGIFQQWRE